VSLCIEGDAPSVRPWDWYDGCEATKILSFVVVMFGEISLGSLFLP